MNTTLDEMRVLIAAVDSGALSRAALQLGLTVSAVSRTLGRLEEKLATTLLQRTTRRLELTEEGRAYLDYARRIVAEAEAAEEMLALRRSEPAGRLRVDAATPFMLHVIVPLVAGYRQRYPGVALELTSHEGWIDLLEERTDVAIRIGTLKDSSLHARPIGSSRLRLLAAPEYLQRHGEPQHPAELATHARLGFTQPAALNLWPVRDAAGAPWQMRPTLAASSGETLRQLALAGHGIVCLSDFMTQQDCAAGRLVPVLAAQTLPVSQPIHAVYYRNTAMSARIATFTEYLREQWRELGGDAPLSPGALTLA